MKLLTPLVPIILSALITAQHARPVNDFDDWHPAVSTDLRSPCPGLNALANHGILPRDGKNITVPILVNALDKLKVSEELATLLSLVALKTSNDPASGTFDLDNLNKHNIIEHDGSLSRKDQALGGDGKFDQEIFDEFLGYFNDSQIIGFKEAAMARWGRIQTERKRDPQFSYSPSARFSSYSESTIYFAALQDPATGTIPVDYIKILFSQERFPYQEGWRPATPMNGLSTGSILLNLALNTPESAGDIVMPKL
ncbi:Cloroperoxidase [Massarina eburnea CBS 473.64]|uniref:Cloroperoxidase n=1 Tax=Massarina eburnea CBS 473.64 TaxID=1395130 RepID=A0A6A6SA60_9PLEO|nr:Cloroperoxidase [Massarina eburnea CBS 473.64]